MKKPPLRQLWIFCMILILALATGGESKNGPRSDEMKNVLQADKRLSRKMANGGCEAFLEYLAEGACLLPRSGHLIRGRKNFQEVLHQAEEKNLQCIAGWEPLDGLISSSGTLAYTYGRYENSSQAGPQTDSPQHNYYASIWQKHASGDWQILFNLGLLDLEEWRNWDSLNTSSVKARTLEEELMDVDRTFSKLSIQKGYLEAFYSYIADNGITVSSGGPPANKETYRKRMGALKAQENPPQVQLVWEPVLAYVASSEDLGFTSGEYTSSVTDAAGQKSVQRGYYLSIWTKQPDGTWKFIFDGGNQVRE